MNTIKKNSSRPAAARAARQFPAEAYEFEDDVTEEGIEKVRTKAAPVIEAEEWELVDGFERAPRS